MTLTQQAPQSGQPQVVYVMQQAQQWEYCAVGPIRGLYWIPHYPGLYLFTHDGLREVDLRVGGGGKREIDRVAKVIADLGDEGWELAGCGSIVEEMHHLYFKRPKQQPPKASGEPIGSEGTSLP